MQRAFGAGSPIYERNVSFTLVAESPDAGISQDDYVGAHTLGTRERADARRLLLASWIRSDYGGIRSEVRL